MKKNLVLLSILPLFAAVALAATYDQTVIRSSAVVTTSYVASATVTNEDAQVTIEVYQTGTAENHTLSLIPQHSIDGVNFIDEPVNALGTIASTEQPVTRTSKRFDFSCNATNLVFTEAFAQWGGCRFFRVKLKDAGAGTTNATIQILATTSKNPI